MFNGEQKLKFIEEQLILSNGKDRDKTRTALRNFFERLSAFEESKKKDFASMSEEEIDETLHAFLSGGKVYQNVVFSFLTKYLNWAIENNLSFLKKNILVGMKVAEIDTSSSYQIIMLRDEQELEDTLNDLLRPECDGSADNLIRCYLHLLYAGVYQTEILNIRQSDIDLDHKSISINGRQIQISDILYKLICNYMKLESYIRHTGTGGVRIDEITRTGYLLENTATLEKKEAPGYRDKMKKTLDASISAKLLKGEKDLKQNNILISGIFYRMHEIEKSTGEIDCEEYFKMKENTIMAIDFPSRVIELCKTEYNTWKKAFNL